MLRATPLALSEDIVWIKFLRKKEKTLDLTGINFVWLVFRILVLLSRFYEVVFKYLLPTAKFIHSAFIIQSSLLY